MYKSNTIIYLTMIENRVISYLLYIRALAPERGTSEVYLLNDSMLRIELSLNLKTFLTRLTPNLNSYNLISFSFLS